MLFRAVFVIFNTVGTTSISVELFTGVLFSSQFVVTLLVMFPRTTPLVLTLTHRLIVVPFSRFLMTQVTVSPFWVALMLSLASM